MSFDQKHLQNVQASLDAVSPSFCLAKWTQVSIHLHNGTTHSCHHPGAHKIPAEQLEENPSVLHNTPQKIRAREEMLKGVRPQECDYCWRVEDAPGRNISDRIFKSGFSWSFPFRDRVLSRPLDPHFMPTYVEVNLGDICNFKCSYCKPEVSSRWMNEVKEFGPYPVSNGHSTVDAEARPLPADQINPYREAFWQWWPELYGHLHTFRVTGGEPLLNKDLFKVLDWIKDHPHANLTFGVNTNLCPPEEIWRKFLTGLKEIAFRRAVKRLEVYTSAEAWGAQSEYIRFGMNFEMWRSRLWELMEAIPQVHVVIMATYNALSVTSFDRLLEEVLKIKQTERFHSPERLVPLFLDISYLRFPNHQSIKVLPLELGRRIQEHALWMAAHAEILKTDLAPLRRGFLSYETQKMERIWNWYRSDQDEWDKPMVKAQQQRDFFIFFQEHDRRRKTNFLQTFPEFEKFWNDCQKLGKSLDPLKSP